MSLLISLEKLSFDNLKKIITDKNIILEKLLFFNDILKKYNSDKLLTQKTIKKVLSAYMIFYYKEDVTLNADIYSEKIFELAKDFVLSFEEYEKSVNYKNYNNFVQKLFTYLTYFNTWQNRESLIISRPLINSYHSITLEVNKLTDFLNEEKNQDDENYELLNKRKNEFNLQLKSLERKIFSISGEEGMKYVRDKNVPVFGDEKIFSDIEKTAKQAFWDVFEENIKERKYECLKQTLTDLKEFIFKYMSNDMKNEFNELLDYTILFNLIDETQKVSESYLNTEYIKNIMLVFISYLEKAQAAAEDKNTKTFKEVLLLKLNNETEEKLLRFFFENMFLKYENIQRGMHEFYTGK